MEELILEITKGVQDLLENRNASWATAIEWAMLKTLSAVRDGLEIPGEVSRWDPSDTWPPDDWAVWCYEQLEARTLIALAGTGKEEE